MYNYLTVKFLCRFVDNKVRSWYAVHPIAPDGKYSLPFELYSTDDDLSLPELPAEYLDLDQSLIVVTRIKYFDENNCLLFCEYSGEFRLVGNLLPQYDFIESLESVREYLLIG